MYICRLINELKIRGFIFQLTNENKIIDYLYKKPISLYCGFDPTADSLHVGHILPLLCLRFFQLNGHIPIILIGTATSLIGDPSFKENFREDVSLFSVNIWEKNIHKQLKLFIDFKKSANKAILLNNYSWFKKINVLYFIRDFGKYFPIRNMLNKESIKKRIYRKKKGILFSEFSYNLLQAYDFMYLNLKYNVILQIGGSDQWGNIISGIDLTRKVHNSKVFGMTFPLLVQSNGIKFGKTEKNTVWLDSNKTSVYKFFQFWLNISDKDALKFFKFLHIFSLSKLIKLEEKFFCFKIHPNYLKYTIACFLTSLIHGKENLFSVKRITFSLFKGNINYMKFSDFKKLEKDGIPSLKIKSLMNLQTVLVLSSFSRSKTQAKSLIFSNSISVNQKKITDINYFFKKSDKLYNRYTLLSKGKKNHLLIIWEE